MHARVYFLNLFNEFPVMYTFWLVLGHANVVKLLIAHGADVNAQDDMKYSPLHWAAARGDLF